MKLRLEVMLPGRSAFVVEPSGHEALLGRDPGCAVVFSGEGSQSVSWQHARIDLSPSGAMLVDLGSSNGTYVEDQRISGPTRLEVGQYLRLGRSGPYLKVVALDLIPRPVPALPRPKPERKSERKSGPKTRRDDPSPVPRVPTPVPPEPPLVVAPVVEPARPAVQKSARLAPAAPAEAMAPTTVPVDAPTPPPALEGTRTGMMRQMLVAVQGSQRRLFVILAVVLLSVAAGVVGVVFWYQGQASQLAELANFVRQTEARLKEGAERWREEEEQLRKQLAELHARGQGDHGKELTDLLRKAEERLKKEAEQWRGQEERMRKELADLRARGQGDHNKELADLFRNTEERLKKEAEHWRQREEQMRQELAAARRGEPDVLNQAYNASVFLVQAPLLRAGKVTVFSGTAFVIDAKGILATNAHVAQPVRESLTQGRRPTLLGKGARQPLEIVDVQWHRDYVEDDILSPDVGLLTVRPKAGEAPLKAVPLAGTDELKRLLPGAALCYIGFPKFNDDDYDDPAKVSARVYSGLYNRALPGRGGGGDIPVLEHNIDCWDGASGGPIFSREGKAVAVLNGMIFLDRERKEARSPNKTAIRVDHLKGPMVRQ